MGTDQVAGYRVLCADTATPEKSSSGLRGILCVIATVRLSCKKEFVMQRLALLLSALCGACLLVSCDDETTAPRQEAISVTSYVISIDDADLALAQELPTADLQDTVIISEADSTLTQGAGFTFTAEHGTGMQDLLIGVDGAVGYFVLAIEDSLASATEVTGSLAVATDDDFTLLCFARSANGSVTVPARHGIRVVGAQEINYYIDSVEGATFVDETVPSPTKGVTICDVIGDSVVVNGGTARVTLCCTVPASAVIIGAPGTFGYYRLPTQNLPGDVEVVATISQTAPSNFILHFLTEEPNSEYGTVAAYAPILIRVGTGILQVSLTFRPSQDVDLHLVEPTGEEIYYGYPASAAGGELDLDSNPACNLDHINNENITYPDTVTPPTGEYIVRVDYWESCDGGGADFSVITRVQDEDPNLYTGHFEAWEADGGGPGSGREICRFTYPP
jgi:hypothetical protein